MHRRMILLIAAMALAAAACGTSATPTEAPTTSGPASGPPAQITITAATGLTYTFFVTSCESPGTNVVNLQGEGEAGDFRLATSVQGGFTITGPAVIDATVDEIEVAEDGSVTATGTLSDPDAPDISAPFELKADPGSCP
jgi:ABC-type glycerol-3-phosphate transport system substrate-binding protein